MCCLGFLGKQLGVPYTKMTGVGGPMELRLEGRGKFLDAGLLKPDPFSYSDRYFNTEVCDKLITVNDSTEKMFSGKYREARITALFKKIGVKVRFVGK
jgi:hypothetical protein